MCPDDTAPDGAVLIPLCAKNGSIKGYTLVDTADAEWAGQWAWGMTSSGYVVRCARVAGRPVTFRLHRELLGLIPGDGMEVDHINRDRRDNRRVNIRVITKLGNSHNKPSYTSSTSSFRGVCWHKASNRWISQVKADGKTHYLGIFASESEAAHVAKEARRALLPYSVD